MRVTHVLLVLSFYILDRCFAASTDCDCTHHNGGCTINTSAPKGWKCQCLYNGFWSCSGVPYPCRDNEKCPGNRADYCSCKVGGGDCGGYYINSKDKCSKDDDVSFDVSVPASGTCDCNYHPGGCSIETPAPAGFKCVCVYKGFWTCSGWAQGCHPSEYCPGGLYTYCGCKQGKGDCWAYPESTSDPDGKKCSIEKPAVRTCNCNRNSDWTSSSFKVTDVVYNMDKAKRSALRPEAVGSKDIPNASTSKQAVEFWVTKSLSTTYRFKHTAGIAIIVGMTIEISLPFKKLAGSISVDRSYSYEWGKESTQSLGYTHRFTCNGEAKRHTICNAFLTKGTLEVPYTMKVRHNEIPDCHCDSKGVWTGVEHFDHKMVAKDLGSCNSIRNGECRP